jgi:uncharacterized SAM-binding protein YcdF (DUF218 family)
MGFLLSKILLSLLLPPASLLILVMIGIVMLRRHQALGRALVIAGIALLYLLSLPPVGDRLIRPLEAAYRPFSGTAAQVGAVVVLSGGANDLSWVPAETAPSDTSLERLAAGIHIARTGRLHLVISGGSGLVTRGGPKEADAMADAAVRLGFPRRDLVIENQSRNTWESAQQVRTLLPGQTIILVTSAFHMKRSAGMFRKQGFTVVPAPTGYKSQTRPFSITCFIPGAGALHTSATALSEYLSLAWYGIMGKLES